MANLFAQNSANWDSANMWSTAVGGGAGTYVTPGVSDVCMANGKTVTVNISSTVSQVRNDTTGGATAGGTFSLSNGITLTANVTAGTSGSAVTFAVASPGNSIITGNIANGNGGHGVTVSGTGVLTINGNLNEVYSTAAYCINVSAPCTLNINGTTSNIGSVNNVLYFNTGSSGCVCNFMGDVVPGTLNQASAIGITQSITLNITGNVYGASASNGYGIYALGAAPVINITGDVIGRSGISIYINSSNPTLTVNGNVYTTGGGAAISSTTYFVGTINGNVTASSAAGVYSPAINLTAGKVDVYGTATTGEGYAGAPAIVSSSSLMSTVTSVVGASNNTTPAIYGYVRIRTPFPATTYKVRDSDGVFYTFYTDTYLSSYAPQPSDVRYGTTYQLGGIVGTMRVPLPSQVLNGVAVDNTIGTANLDATSFWNAPIESLTTTGSIGDRLKNAATPHAIAAILANSYSKRFDYSAPYAYTGRAPYGSDESSNVWEINRITVNDDGTTSTKSARNVAWSNRVNVIYG